MDSKDRWTVVKFIVAGTGFRRRDARKMLVEISHDKYARLFLEARAWNQEMSHRAGAKLAEIVGKDDLETLRQATIRAQVPSGRADDDSDEDEEPTPKRKPAARRTHR